MVSKGVGNGVFTLRALIQRVSMAKVTVDNQILGQIQNGLLILLGITHGDTEEKAAWLAEKQLVWGYFRMQTEKWIST